MRQRRRDRPDPNDSRALARGPAEEASGLHGSMRLVLYVKGFPPRETGGPVEVAFHVARELLRARNIHVTLVVQTDSTEEEVRGLLGGGDHLEILRLPYYPSARELRAVLPLVRAFASADLIHFNEFPFRHLPLIVLGKARGVPVVFSLHGPLSQEMDAFLGPSYPLTFGEGDRSVRVPMPRIAIRALRAAYQSFSRAWTAVIVPSEALKKTATSVDRVPWDRLSAIPHGVEPPAAQARVATPHSGPPRVLFVGKLEPVKGPDLLLEAVDRLVVAGIPLDVSLVGGGSLEAELRTRATELRSGRVTFLGVRRGRDLDPLYAAADIVVVPSRQESLSMVVLEAMAAGCPILATDVGGIPEIAHEPRNALLVRPDPDALAGGLRRLIEEPSLRASMAEANRLDARQRTWAVVVDRYVSLYRALLGRSDFAATRST